MKFSLQFIRTGLAFAAFSFTKPVDLQFLKTVATSGIQIIQMPTQTQLHFNTTLSNAIQVYILYSFSWPYLVYNQIKINYHFIVNHQKSLFI